MSNLFDKVVGGRQFNFQPFELGNERGYHVNVKDEEGTRWEFRMFHVAETLLKIEGEKLPSWIANLEPELNKVINEHE